MISCMLQIQLCIWIIGYFSFVYSVPFIDPAKLEIQDELYDMEIYKAVVNSMNKWQKKHDFKKTKNRTKRDDPSVCYAELGCFEASGPFGYLDMLPSKPEEINTRFLMYPTRTRRRRSGSTPAEIPFEKLVDAFEWAKNGFNKSLPTKVLIHGFGSDCGYIWAYEIRSALMAVEEVNTICVDWSNGASLPNYIKASANTRLVGKQLSLLLRGLVEKNGLSLQMTHLIGFSLGAHIAGFAGADLGNLSRITGLDPAGPLFESQDTRARLDQTDAGFVDVIHSNGENLILGGLGTSQPMGHVDFYPNGGRMQKGCSHLFVGAVSDIIWSSAVEGRSLCNHRRAYKFFIDSVSPRCHFPAFPCDSYNDFLAGQCFPCTGDRKCGNMGYYADKSKGRGQLYLITRDEEPFCAHQYLVKIESAPRGSVPVKNYGKIKITLIGDSFLNETFMMTGKEDEEMKLGESISKILVPHPILSTPSRIEILYTAYSGWLSSGLTQWKVENVTLTDSFGEMLSTCNQTLVLQSGVPVILLLYPGNCSEHVHVVPLQSKVKEAEDRMQEAENHYPVFSGSSRDKEFIPTQVVKAGLKGESEEEESWIRKENNFLTDNEPLTESSRAFSNSKTDKLNKNQGGLIKEVVEPILKLQQQSTSFALMKNGRSHEPNKTNNNKNNVMMTMLNKVEITEPILGPTTVKTSGGNSGNSTGSNKLMIEKENAVEEERWRRVNESKSLKYFNTIEKDQSNPLDSIVTTVQLIPQRLARMFEQAETFARENILPLVSTYTPRIISDFIDPNKNQEEQTQYIPLNYNKDFVDAEEDEGRSIKKDTNTLQEIVSVVPTQIPLKHKEKEEEKEMKPVIVNLPTFQQKDNDDDKKTEDDVDEGLIASPSHIQKISKKKNTEKIHYIFPRNKESSTSTSTTITSITGSKNTESSPTLTTTSSSSIIKKNTNTFTFNRANSSFTIEIDTPTKNSKTKRQGKSLQISQNINLDNSQRRESDNHTSSDINNNNNFKPIESFVNVMQTLPDRFARMINQAQDYTRRNILPFMENYTPRQLSDLIWIRHRPKNVTVNVERTKNNRIGNFDEEKLNVGVTVDMMDRNNGDNRDRGVMDVADESTKTGGTITSQNIISTTTINTSTISSIISTTSGTTSWYFRTSSGSNTESSTSTSNSTSTTISTTTQFEPTTLVPTTTTPPAETPTESNPPSSTTSASLISRYLQRFFSTIRNVGSLVPALKLIPIATAPPTPQAPPVPSVPPTTTTSTTMPAGRKVISFFFPTTSTSTTSSTATVTRTSVPFHKYVNEVGMISSTTPVPVLLYDAAKTVFGLKYVIGSTTPKVVKQELLSKKEYIQRIPRKGEKLQYVTPFTVVIDANDLTTTRSTSTSTPSTTTKTSKSVFIKKPYVSYVQKIPKKGFKAEKKKTVLSHKVVPKKPLHPLLLRNTKAENVNLYTKDQYGGGDMIYHITSDGRFEI